MKDEHLQYSLDSERAVLGCIIIDGSLIKDVREILKHEDFFDKHHQYIFRAMEWLDNGKVEIDLLTLTDALTKKGFIELIGGSAYLSELTDCAITPVRVMTYAKIVEEYSAKRQITSAANAISEVSSNGSSVDEALAKVKEQISIVNTIGGKQNKYQVASMSEYIDKSKERFENWGKIQGLSSGFPCIDKLTLGLSGGELIIIAGPTSKGKTLLSMSIANNIAKIGGKILFVSLEMSPEELTSRYMYINGGWDTEDFKLVAANTIFQKNDELTWQDVDGLIENAKNKLGVDLVIIDHLHYFTRELQNVAEDLGRITKEFKKNAIRHNLPIILISHIRKLMKDEELSGESLRGSSLIAQDADIVLLVNRDPETNAMGVLIDKNRNRGKLSDRTPNWEGRSARDIDTSYLNFNNTKLTDPTDIDPNILSIFPGATRHEE